MGEVLVSLLSSQRQAWPVYHKGKYVGTFGGGDAGWDAAVKAQVHLAPLVNWVSF